MSLRSSNNNFVKDWIWPALVILFGQEILRVFFPCLAWYLRDTVGIPSLKLAPFAFGPFLVVFLTPLLWRLVGQSRLLFGATLGVLLSRFIMQIVVAPLVLLLLSVVGAAAFVLFLVVFVCGHGRRRRLLISTFLGFTFDSVLRSATTTLDIVWISGFFPVIFLAIAMGFTIVWARDELHRPPPPEGDRGWSRVPYLVALGPLLFFELMFLQNQGWVAQVFGLSARSALLSILIMNAIIMVSSCLFWKDDKGNGVHPLKGAVGVGSGMVLFVAMVFIYYFSFDIKLPLLRTSTPRSVVRHVVPSSFTPWFCDMPIRVMTYNIHSAYTTEGRQDPEGIARAIETQGADVIALQEVSRGWLIDGSTDLVEWLARRLKMQIFFAPTADAVWGNALLTKLPVLDYGSAPLPSGGAPLHRGYLWVTLKTDLSTPLTVIVTHLHHIATGSEVRMMQVEELMHVAGITPHTILMGDMNAEPTSPEMALISRTGFVDAWGELKKGEGNTFSADHPTKRIDWIWHTSDLRANEVETICNPASDHCAVTATISH